MIWAHSFKNCKHLNCFLYHKVHFVFVSPLSLSFLARYLNMYTILIMFVLNSFRVVELEEVLPEINDIATLKTITRSRPVPSQLRARIWQVCLSKPKML
jgi:hypothetical protein